MVQFKLKVEPLEHQKRAVEFTLRNPSSIIASATGSGKTYAMLLQALLFVARGKVDKSILVVTKKSKHSFETDIKKLLDLNIDNTIQVIYDEEDIWELSRNPNKVIGIVQYEVFKNIPVIHWKDFLTKHKTLVELDEYHKAKTAMTELYIPRGSTDNTLMEKPILGSTILNKYLYELRPLITYMTGYTATPLTKSIVDAFWLGTLIQPGIFNDSLLDFYRTYIRHSAFLIPIKKGSKFKRTAINTYGYKNTDLLIEKLNSLCFNYFPKVNINYHLKKYDPTEVMTEYLKAVSGVLDKYTERKINEETGEKEDKEFSARMLDAQYVLNNSYAKKLALLHTLKDTISNGVLIYCNYYNTVDAVKYVLANARVPYEEISGKTSDKECKRIMSWFNNDPKNKVVILTAAGAQSINLQATNNFIFYDLPYTSGAYIQALGRITRIGSKYDEFNVYVLLSDDTLDFYKYEYLASNEDTMRYLQGNPNFLPSGDIKSPNTELLRKLRKSVLWDKQKK